jgi:DNA-binding GntR family transcriptional regulator
MSAMAYLGQGEAAVERDAHVILSEQAFRLVRRDILVGVLPADRRLKLEELQNQYGLSSSPLREALSRLREARLVMADQRRGFRVAPVSIEDLADLTRLRELVDLQALSEAMQAGGDAWEGRIVAAYHQLARAEQRLGRGPDVLQPAWSDAHRQFHLTLIDACPSARLRLLAASLFDQVERYRHLAARLRKQRRSKSDEHHEIMSAVLRRDIASAGDLLKAHIGGTLGNLKAALEASTGDQRRAALSWAY